MTKNVKSKSKTVQEAGDAAPHILRAEESQALHRYLARLDKETAPNLRVVKESGAIAIDYPHKGLGELLLIESFGTSDSAFAAEIISQLLAESIESGQVSTTRFDALVSIVTSCKPRNEFEAMLAMQAAISHFALMKIGRQMGAAETLSHWEIAQRIYTKLARTFLDQMQALRRDQAGGDITVQQHVSVSQGGQAAVVAHVTNANAPSADMKTETPTPSPPALSDARSMPLQVIDGNTAVPEKVERFRGKRL